MIPPDATITYDLSEMEVDRLTAFIQGSDWGADLTKAEIHRAFDGSCCAGLIVNGRQVAFARAISDQALDAYLKDVFVFADHRGQGFGAAVMTALMDHPLLKTVRSWYLGTKDAHGFYERLGFRKSPDGVYMNLMREV